MRRRFRPPTSAEAVNIFGSSKWWFFAVGGAAALTHMGVFAISREAVPPEWANLAGFVVAFAVSFVGHRWLSFQDAGTSLTTSLGRFAVTAVTGFACNELCFVLLLRGLGWPPLAALVVALVLAAGQTFWLSRFWAFRR